MSRTMILSALLAFVLIADQAAAIPAFARKYDMSCMTCHSPMPRLKAYGEEFAGNGFRLADKDAPRFTRETGDDELLLMREIPLALRLEGSVRWLPQEAGRSDIQAPYLLKLLSGGEIARDVAYYFYFFFGERGKVAGLEDAFIMFNDVFGTDLDVYLGQFQVSDPLFKRELRLTLEDYQVYRTAPGRSRVNLTYDRGLMLTYGLPTGTDVTFELLNGSGIDEADVFRNFDTDKHKNAALRLSQDVVDGVRLGAFGYYGKEADTATVNTVWMAGPDLTLSTENLELNIQYMERRDDDPGFVFAVKETRSRGAFAELIYSPDGDRSSWFGAALYNWVEIGPGIARYHSITGHVSYIAARNLRLIGEYTYEFGLKSNRVAVGFVSAF